MKMNKFAVVLLLMLALSTLFFISCKTDSQIQDEKEDIKIEEEPEIIEDPAEVTEQKPEEPQAEKEFVVTEEIYDNTFEEITNLISNINTIISDEKFEEWKSFLSESYINKYSNEKTLENMSQSPILLNNDIELNNLNDYFQYIVVPSRFNVKVEEIEFEGEHKIIVWSSFNGRRVKLYQLEKIDDNWKISTW